MNKKQRNRKIVAQNKRNRLINRHYTSTIKTLSKLFSKKVKGESLSNSKEKLDLIKITNSLYSIIDKAVKKGILHKNTAGRKKSKVGKLFNVYSITFLEKEIPLKV